MPINIRVLQRKIRSELETKDLLSLIDRAVELIPEERLSELIENFFDPDSLSLVDEASKQVLVSSFLLLAVRRFFGRFEVGRIKGINKLVDSNQ
jgi:hypothetical protein